MESNFRLEQSQGEEVDIFLQGIKPELDGVGDIRLRGS